MNQNRQKKSKDFWAEKEKWKGVALWLGLAVFFLILFLKDSGHDPLG